MRRVLVLLVAVLVVFLPRITAAQPTTDAGPASVAGAPAEALPPLRVAVAGSKPFVMPPGPGESQPKGLSIDVWRSVAADLGREFEYVQADSVSEALDMVEGGSADVAVGPISITADRARKVSFSQPYFESSLAILASASQSALSRLKPFLTSAFLTGVGVLLLVLLLVGTLVWLAERGANPEQFPADAVRGISNGVWMALVTMTTVGYGDRVPVTGKGRLTMGVWMIISMITASSIIAFMATALTLSQLDKPAISTAGELRGQRVAVVPATTGLRFVQRHGGRVVESDSVADAIDEVLKGNAAAVVYDRPMLRYYLSEHGDVPLALSPVTYEPQGYGFAVRPGSELEQPIDIAILRLRHDGKVETFAQQWLGP